MNIHKHMEAIFVVTLAAVGVGTLAFDSLPEAGATSAAPAPVMRDVPAPDVMREGGRA